MIFSTHALLPRLGLFSESLGTPLPYDYAELIAEIAPRPALLCLLQLLSLSLSRDAKRCSRVITMRSEILDQICPWFGRDLRPNFL